MTVETIGALLSLAFGLWAGVVGWAAKAILHRMDVATADLRALDKHLQMFITQTEHRLTKLEANNHEHNK